MPKFVIHYHISKKPHYDFRLEMGGVLKSWAVPKEPPSERNIKRLAVEVEDHALSYIDFEGMIPEGDYGAGKVVIWDSGSYELTEKNDNEIKFSLRGKKLKGEYLLIRFKKADRNNQKYWLLFKA